MNGNTPSGVVYLAGAGPGDPGLLTVRCRDLLASCEVLVFDALVTQEVLALAHPRAERIYVGKRGNRHDAEQPEINSILETKAREGKRILRLKGGDPYLFGRGAEEALYLVERGVRVEIVPGVTAGIAAPAYAGIPVTHRALASAVTFVTGHEDPAKPETALDWAALSKSGTLCIYMGIKNLGRVVKELSAHLPGTTPAAVIQWGTTPRQRTVAGTLADIETRVREAGLEAPALTVIGQVCALREKLAFFERRSLFGKRIVVTRARDQASALVARLSELGAEALEFPTIRIAPAEDLRPLQAAVRQLAHFRWIVLASVNGVDALFDELAAQGHDARALGRCKVAAVGPATAARLAEKGIVADLTPPKYVAEEIVECLKRTGVFDGLVQPGADMLPQDSGGSSARLRAVGHDPTPRFLLPRADIARSTLPQLLRAQGADVTEVVAYRTAMETEGRGEILALLEAGEIDAITFTSGSTARNFAKVLGTQRLTRALASPRLKCFSIGPVTSETMRECGLPVHGEAEEHDIPGLVDLIVKSGQAAT